jgi:hypothetical protein
MRRRWMAADDWVCYPIDLAAGVEKTMRYTPAFYANYLCWPETIASKTDKAVLKG